MELGLNDKKEGDAPARPDGDNVANFRRDAPGWASGLRRLYDSVVDEPLPDSFDDLLKKLDEADGK